MSKLISESNRLLPLSEEGMLLRVFLATQQLPVGSITWFVFIATHSCYS